MRETLAGSSDSGTLRPMALRNGTEICSQPCLTTLLSGTWPAAANSVFARKGLKELNGKGPQQI